MFFGDFVDAVSSVGGTVAGGVSDVAGGAADLAEDAYDAGKELADDAAEIANDPVGYFEKKLGDLSWDKVTGAVTLGLDDVAADLAREAGLGPLVDGIDAFASVMDDVMDIVLRFVQCVQWLENSVFWALSAALYAARTQGWISSKAECTAFAQKGEIAKALGANVPIFDMLPCAAEVAFTAPLPSEVAGAASAATGGSPGAKAQAALNNSAVGQAMGAGKIAHVILVTARPPAVNAVSRSADKLDIFIVRPDGLAATAAWQPGDKAWRGWWIAASVKASPGGPVTAVSRGPDKLDVFTVAHDGRVYTAAWEQGRDTAWRGWWPIGDVKTLPGTVVGAVSRSRDKLDIFVTGGDGRVYTAAWEPGRDTAWRGWWPVANGQTTPGTPVSAVSRSADKLDVFMVGLDGRVWTAAWQPGDQAWRGWWPIGDVKTLPGTAVGVVSRSQDKLDIFVTGVDGRVYTAAWEQGRDTAWRGWWPVANGQTTPGTPISAVSRSADKLDVFMVGLDGRVWTAAWQPGDQAWRGWWPISDVKTLHRSPVSVVSRSKDKLDIFVRGLDRAIYSAAWEQGRDTAWRGWWRLS